MSRSLINLTVNNDLQVAIANTLGTLESQLKDLVPLTVAERRKATKMGQKSEQFCRQTLTKLKLYPNIVPGSVGLEEALADIDTLDRMREEELEGRAHWRESWPSTRRRPSRLWKCLPSSLKTRTSIRLVSGGSRRQRS